MRGSFLHLCAIFFLLCILSISTGCKKEFSYEGGASTNRVSVPISGSHQDTSGESAITFPVCEACEVTNSFTGNTWSFKAGNSILCGTVTNAVLSPDRNAITFFGPSTCSVDTGLIITAYFNSRALDKDQTGLPADGATLQYYDNVSGVDILQSKQPQVFQLIFQSYSYEKRMATGTFSGSVTDKNGSVYIIKSGKFMIRF